MIDRVIVAVLTRSVASLVDLLVIFITWWKLGGLSSSKDGSVFEAMIAAGESRLYVAKIQADSSCRHLIFRVSSHLATLNSC